MADRESKRVAKPSFSFLAELVDFIPLDAMRAVLQVFKHGAAKYGKDNWLTPPHLSLQEITDSLLRHTFAAIRNPYSIDPDSGIPHVALAAVNAIFLVVYVQNEWFDKDDAPAPKEEEVDDYTALRAKTLARINAMLEQAKAPKATQPEVPVVSTPPVDEKLEALLSDFNADDFSEFLEEGE